VLKILLALLVVSLTAALWLLSDTLGLPGWAAAWATVGALLLLVAMVALELLQRRSRRLRDQKRQAERSPFHQTLGNLRSRCEHATEALRAQNAEQLPWVLLLGPTSAGKTAALRSSGLRFLDGLGPERFITNGDVSPTESVQFLASDRLVFVDTAGRYLCETPDHEDRREWLALLALLRTQRAQRPLSGVVLAISAESLARSQPEAAAQLGLGLRRRLEDIQREFTATFPVYLLITRIDELAGLSRIVAAELAARTPGEEPHDRFGFELELSGAGASSARRVAEGPLAELSLALERRAFALIEQSSTPEERGEIYRAPGHFRRLAERSADLLGTLFPDHGQADAPIFRGLYFATAGASTITPAAAADLELQALARDYGDLPQRGAAPPAPLARPAFLRGLFAQVIPDDSWVAGWTRRRQGQQRVRHGLRVALLASAALGLLSLSLGSAQSNHRLQGELSAAITALQSDAGNPRLPLRPAQLAPIQAVHDTLHAHREDGAPWSLRLGLYQGSAVADEVERVYFTTARDRLLQPTVARAQAQLTRLLAQHKDSSAALPTELYWPAVDALHLYILLTRPGTGPVTLQDVGQRMWLAANLPRAWAHALDLTEREQAEARSVSRDYVDALASRTDDLVRRDDTLVPGIREILRRTSRGQLWADELALEQIPGAGAIALTTIASAAWLTTKEGRRVEAAYTRKGWDHVRSKIRCPAAFDERYLAAALTIDERLCTEERAALHGQYFKRYVESWTQFLGDIYVREPEGYKDIESQIVDMTTPGGPGVNALENLFRVVGENAQLPMVADASAQTPPDEFIPAVFALARRQAGLKGVDLTGGPATAADQVTVATVRDAFKPYYSYGYSPPGTEAAAASPLQAYILLLSRVAHPLGLYTKERNGEALTQARTVASQVYELVHNEHFTQRDRRWTPALEGLLDPPVRGLLDAINRGALDELTTRWCNEVVYPFDTMRPCYPFNKAATCDVSGDEVAGLFQPQSGKLWTLYNDALAARFPFQGDRYVPAPQGYNSRVKLNPAVARFMTNARELGDVLFPAASPGPSFSFAVQFKPLETASQITLTIDGTPISYNNSDRDRFQPMTWPGQGGAPLTRLEAQIKGGLSKVEGAGFWGLYRLIEQGNVVRSGRLVVVKLLFNDRVTSAEIRLNPQDGAGNPLFGKVRALPEPGQAPEVGLMDIFREQRLSPPRQLFTNGMTCKPLNLAAPSPSAPTPAP